MDQVNKTWIEAHRRMLTRVRESAAQPIDLGFPHIGDVDGTWIRSPDGDWTGGFWVGELWLANDVATALEWCRRLAVRTRSDTIFRSFLFYYGAVLGARLHRSEIAAEIALTAAVKLAEAAHRPSRLLGLGEQAEEASDVGATETSIDAVGAVAGLLSWGANRTGDTYLLAVATAHTKWCLDNLVRSDGSVVQSATFEPLSGTVLRTYTHKGASPDSTWARAQAWGLLGATQGALWLHGQRDELLARARQIGDWWIAHVPTGGVPYWDFDVPADGNQEQDTSAAAIAAAAFLKLSALESDAVRSAKYRRTALATIRTLVNRHLTPLTPGDLRPAGMLVDSCYNKRIGLATRNELIWGDYFLLEALSVLTGQLHPLEV
ncbi:hypothetical protein [Kribbella swartbergensis]